MSPPPAGSPPESTGPPDRRTLQLLERVLRTEPLVGETTFEPHVHEPRLLQVVIDDDRLPPSTETVRLDVRWFTSGDFSFHYRETLATGDEWECRWDQHPNEHNSRLHFHRPPDGTEVEDLSLQSLHPIDVCSTVLAAVNQRLEQRWSSET